MLNWLNRSYNTIKRYIKNKLGFQQNVIIIPSIKRDKFSNQYIIDGTNLDNIESIVLDNIKYPCYIYFIVCMDSYSPIEHEYERIEYTIAGYWFNNIEEIRENVILIEDEVYEKYNPNILTKIICLHLKDKIYK